MSIIKRCLSILFAVFGLFVSISASAQFPNYMPQVQAMQRAQSLNNFSNMMMRQSMLFALNNPQYNFAYDYMVVMKDSSKVEVHSKMYSDTASHKNYLLLVDKTFPKKDPRREQKIYPSQTARISRTFKTGFAGKNVESRIVDVTVHGMSNDTCWLFKAAPGKISVYSYLSERDRSGNFTESTLSAMQLDNGPIVRLDSVNLTAMVGQNPDALKAIKKKDYYKAIKKFNKESEKAAK